MGTVSERRATSKEFCSECLDRSCVVLTDNSDSIFNIPRLLYTCTQIPFQGFFFGSYGFDHQSEDNFRGNWTLWIIKTEWGKPWMKEHLMGFHWLINVVFTLHSYCLFKEQGSSLLLLKVMQSYITGNHIHSVIPNTAFRLALPNLSLYISYYKNEINSVYSELLFSSSISVFLKLGVIEPKGSMKGCQGFWDENVFWWKSFIGGSKFVYMN